jgi:hypothetical protein
MPKPGDQEHGAGGTAREVSVKPSTASDNANNDLIRHTQQVWQVLLGRHLSQENARQIAANVTGFFSVLAEWSRAEMATPANDPCGPSASSKTTTRRDR